MSTEKSEPVAKSPKPYSAGPEWNATFFCHVEYLIWMGREMAIGQSGESWNEVNLCGVHALGEINDAKSMMESLIAWKLGMTRQAYFSIMGCLSNAVAGIKPCIEELSSWENQGAVENCEADSIGGWCKLERLE